MHDVLFVKFADSLYNRKHEVSNSTFIKIELVSIAGIISQGLLRVLCNEVTAVVILEIIFQVDDA